jgi:cytochrome b561
MLALKILAGLIILAGFVTIILAKKIVERFGLDKKVKLENENEMEAEDANEYRTLIATVNVKRYGMLIALPGMVLTLIAFR